MKMPPKEKTIIPPEGGWKERTYYVVEVAFNPNNPVHKRILYIGFLNASDGNPFGGGYTQLLSDGNGIYNPDRAHYLKAVCEIKEMRDNND